MYPMSKIKLLSEKSRHKKERNFIEENVRKIKKLDRIVNQNKLIAFSPPITPTTCKGICFTSSTILGSKSRRSTGTTPSTGGEAKTAFRVRRVEGCGDILSKCLNEETEETYDIQSDSSSSDDPYVFRPIKVKITPKEPKKNSPPLPSLPVLPHPVPSCSCSSSSSSGSSSEASSTPSLTKEGNKDVMEFWNKIVYWRKQLLEEQKQAADEERMAAYEKYIEKNGLPWKPNPFGSKEKTK